MTALGVIVGVLSTLLMSQTTSSSGYYILYDVFSTASPSEVKAALDGFTVIFSYKTVGVHRYYFLVADDGSEGLRKVEFPAVKSSNVQPVQTTADYLQQFNVTSGWDEPSSPLPDKDLIVIKWEFRMPGGTSMEQAGDMMKKWGEQYSSGFGGAPVFSYSRIGYYPHRILTFVNLSDKESQRAILQGLDTVGGAAAGGMYVKRIVTI